MDKYERHILSGEWGNMFENDFEELKKDVKENGVQLPIFCFEGKILDGWHRYKAAEIVGRDCPMKEFLGSDPAGFVISTNANRRHLTQGQKAGMVAKCRSLYPIKDDTDPSTADLAEEAGVSVATMARAKAELSGDKSAGDKRKEYDKTRSPAAKSKIEIEEAAIEIEKRDSTIEKLEERVALMSDSENEDLASREQVLVNQRALIESLRASVAELQSKYNEERNRVNGLRRRIKELETELESE